MPAAGRCRAFGLLALQLLLKELHVLEVAPLLLQLLLGANSGILLLGTRCSVPVCCCLLALLPGRRMPLRRFQMFCVILLIILFPCILLKTNIPTGS